MKLTGEKVYIADRVPVFGGDVGVVISESGDRCEVRLDNGTVVEIDRRSLSIHFEDDVPDPTEDFAERHDVKFELKLPWYKRIDWRIALPALLILALAAVQIYRALTS